MPPPPPFTNWNPISASHMWKAHPNTHTHTTYRQKHRLPFRPEKQKKKKKRETPHKPQSPMTTVGFRPSQSVLCVGGRSSSSRWCPPVSIKAPPSRTRRKKRTSKNDSNSRASPHVFCDVEAECRRVGEEGRGEGLREERDAVAELRVIAAGLPPLT